MRFAIEEAHAALSKGNLPSGAIVVLNDEIIGKGYRLSKLDHAEMTALREALAKNKFAKAMTIYTTLEPCIMCFGAILHTSIGRAVYALEDPYGGATCLTSSVMPPRHKIKYPLITRGILREEVMILFKEFFLITKHPFWQSRENPLVKLCLQDNRRS